MTPVQPLRERLIGAAGTAAMIGLTGAGLLWGLAASRTVMRRAELPLIDIRLAPPPPPRPEVVPVKARAAREAPAPRDLKNQATAVVVPPPILRPPLPPPPLIAAPRANIGLAVQTGASDRPGPGEGAGGIGDGSGGGGDGDGEGDVPPRQIRGRLRYSDLPPGLREQGVGGSVGVRYSVEVDGRVGTCTVTASSGTAELDQLTCRLIRERFRFKPLRLADGSVAGSNIVESHSWYVDRSGYERGDR